jgi:leader peptidase (prepilin peptidase) / N-methyltransferase
MIEARAITASEHDLRPNLAVLFGAGGAVALISALSLPWPVAIASITLAALMIAGADIDARTYLIPDTVSCGALLVGILAAASLDPSGPWPALGTAIARAAGTALALATVRWSYGLLKKREGLGFGDVKLAAAVGAWLPLVDIPLCFAVATCAALLTVVLARLRGQGIDATMKLPFGAFLCPALWLVFYAGVLSG